MDWITTSADTKEEFSVADLVTQTASQFVFENVLPGYVYYNEYDAYYNCETGYFYYPKSSLYFHPSTQLYYFYNEQTQNYEIYSNKSEDDEWTKRSYKQRAKDLFGENFVMNTKDDLIIITELLFDLVDKCSFFAGDYSNKSKKRKVFFEEEIYDDNVYKSKNNYFDQILLSNDELNKEVNNIWINEEMTRRMDEEQISSNAPCIRLLEIPSNNLHIITILGASIGFGQNSDIQLTNSELNFEKEILFLINYFEEENQGIYKLIVKINSFNLKLNEKQIFINKEYILSHGDQIKINNLHLLDVHIHRGLNTCQGCEPGIIINSLNQNSEKSIKKYSTKCEYRRQLKSLKQQYGLLDKDKDFTSQNKEKYLDRTKIRKVLNSTSLQTSNEINEESGIYALCKASPIPGCSTDTVQLHSINSIKKEISSTNKGFKLLKGMGWSEGQGLGKNNQGMKTPIETIIKNDCAGLGMFTTKNVKENVANNKLAIFEKIRLRYEQINEK